jgi:hypothetical protein
LFSGRMVQFGGTDVGRDVSDAACAKGHPHGIS